MATKRPAEHVRGRQDRTEDASAEATASMRIEVHSDDTINAQARTYAEYRVFAALAPFAENVKRARVGLRRLERDGTCERISCTVTIMLQRSGSIRIRATAAHAYAAINRIIERLSLVTSRLAVQPPLS